MNFLKHILYCIIINAIFFCNCSNKFRRNVLKIKNGYIKGTEEVTFNKKIKYLAFKGVPYADPPIGNLRFTPPIPKSNWSKILDATKDGNVCAQFKMEDNSVIGSEDCLFINVYTPRIHICKYNKKKKLLPVMVWIHGGGFVFGSSNFSEANPELFLEKKIVFASFNYRLGILGFLSTKDSAAYGNYGLKDQILALKWIQENIKYFGGDPKKVTIFGESAGGVSVSYLVQTQLTDGLFARAIMQSGTSLCSWALSRNIKQVIESTAFLEFVDRSTSETIVNSLRNINLHTLLSISSITGFVEWLLPNVFDGLPFAPVIEPEHNEAVITSSTYDKFKNGEFNKVPMIIGYDSNEAEGIMQVINYIRPYLMTYDFLPQRLIPEDMNIPDNSNIRNDVANIIKSHYFGAIPVTFSTDEFLHYSNDNLFIRPIIETAKLVSKYVPVYFYEFSYEGNLGSPVRYTKGVGHAEDVKYLFKFESDDFEISESDKTTRNRLINFWTNFAKYSNPTPRKKVSENENDDIWPVIDNKRDNISYIEISTNLKISVNPCKNDIDFWKELYDKYGVPPFYTY